MSAPEQPLRGSATFEAGSLHVARLPDENLAMLSRVEFKVLRDGDPNEARAGRDLCLGFLGSAAFGFVGLIATIDWNGAFHLGQRAPFIWTGLLFTMAFASAFGAVIYHRRYKRTLNNSAYSDLMKRLADHFTKQNPPG